MRSFWGHFTSILLHGALAAYVVFYVVPPKVLSVGHGLMVELIEGKRPQGNRQQAPKVIKDTEELISKPIIVASVKEVPKKIEPEIKPPEPVPAAKEESKNIITQKEESFKKVVVAKKTTRKKLPAPKIKKQPQGKKEVVKAKVKKIDIVDVTAKSTGKKPSPAPTAPIVGNKKTSLAEAMGDPDGVKDARDLQQVPGNEPPSYPVDDRLKRREGTVILVAYVTKEGLVEDVQIESSTGSYAMNQESVRAFYKYQFVKDQPGWVRMPYEFQLVGPVKDYGAVEDSNLQAN